MDPYPDPSEKYLKNNFFVDILKVNDKKAGSGSGSISRGMDPRRSMTKKQDPDPDP
jgi:hypothetical protein